MLSQVEMSVMGKTKHYKGLGTAGWAKGLVFYMG